MKVAIQATHITFGGGLAHLNKIIEWFGKISPENQFVLFGKNGQERLFIPPPGNFEYHFYETPAHNLITRLWWGKYRLPGLLSEHGCDILFEPGNYGASNITIPKVALIHNIAPFAEEYIKTETVYQKLRLRLLRMATLKSMREAHGVIYLSEYCKSFFADYVDHSSRKTKVIFHGKPENQTTDNYASILKKYGISGEYLLSVTHIYRYKKIKEMVRSYLLALAGNPDLPPLYIAGARYDSAYAAQIESIISNSEYGAKVILMGNVAESELPALYAGSQAFLFSSALETCSVTLIEALEYGCAIGCSDRAVMPEVGGAGALYFDPDNIEDFARIIRVLVEDKKLNGSLRQQAKKRAEFFSWEKTARQTLDFFAEVLGQSDDRLLTESPAESREIVGAVE